MGINEQHELNKRVARSDEQVARLAQMWREIKQTASDAGYIVTRFDIEMEGEREIDIRLTPITNWTRP